MGVSPADGRLLWQRPFSTQYDMNIVMPVVHEDAVIVGGFQKPTAAFRVVRTGDRWTTEELWENPDVWLYMTNGVLVGDRLFGLSHRNRGQYVLFDAKSGQTVWAGDPRQADNTSIVRAGDLLMMLEDDAELLAPRMLPWRAHRPTRGIVSTMIEHDLYHAGEINHVRSLLAGNDRWAYDEDP